MRGVPFLGGRIGNNYSHIINHISVPLQKGCTFVVQSISGSTSIIAAEIVVIYSGFVFVLEGGETRESASSVSAFYLLSTFA
jgi:hypothetical protein